MKSCVEDELVSVHL